MCVAQEAGFRMIVLGSIIDSVNGVWLIADGEEDSRMSCECTTD